MDKTIRRLTYSIFFLLFFIIAPILTMYAIGYRYDFKNGNLEKNGAFYVKSYPKGANIFIDGQKIDKETPTQITSVKSGTYNLMVKKNLYAPWEKQLSVYSGQTTFAEDIVLFLNNREKSSLGAGSDNYLLNRQENKYAYIDAQKRLSITDIEQNKNFEIFTFNIDYELIDWSADNQKIILKNKNNYYIFDVNQRYIYPLDISSVSKIIWENGSEDILYLKNQEIFRYDASQINNTTTESLNLDKQINDFAVKDNSLLIQYSLEQNNFVDQIDKDSHQIIQTISDVGLGNLELVMAKDDYLIFSVGSKLYIKSPNKNLISIPVTIVSLHDDRLLISNGHEIILYNYKDDWQELIDRSTQIVSELMWHPNGSYFIYEINGQTYLSEIDSRDKRNIIEILNDPRKKNYLFNKKGDKLFILTPEENFYLTIQ
ncbi:MAG: PEGA domain-containing protein [bacterium]|nr:PEGA domain-containing protein [bacterium]